LTERASRFAYSTQPVAGEMPCWHFMSSSHTSDVSLDQGFFQITCTNMRAFWSRSTFHLQVLRPVDRRSPEPQAATV